MHQCIDVPQEAMKFNSLAVTEIRTVKCETIYNQQVANHQSCKKLKG